MSVLFALVAAIGWGSSDFAAGHASRRSSAVSVVILTHFAAVVALVVVSLIPGQQGTPTLSDLAWGTAAGLGGGFGAMLLFRGLGKGSMAVVAPITATGAASIPVMAGVLQGESITISGVAGVLLALIAIVMVSLAGESGDDDVVDPAAPSSNGWAPPRGLPVSTVAPSAVVDTIVKRAGDMPAPLTYTSLLAPPTNQAPATPAGAVALLERPPESPALRPPPLTTPPRVPFGPPVHPVAARPLAPPSTANRIDLPSAAVAPASRPSRRGVRSVMGQAGVVDALLSGIGFGLFFVFIARTAESAGHWPLVSARGISVVMFVVGALIARGAVLPERGSRRAVVLAGCLDAAAALFFVLSTRDGLLSVGAVLASLYPAVTIVLARFISNERIVKRQLVGLALAAGAVSLLAI